MHSESQKKSGTGKERKGRSARVNIVRLHVLSRIRGLKECGVYDLRLVHKFRILWTIVEVLEIVHSLLLDTTHVQINHAVTSAVKTIPVLMEGHTPNCTTTPNKSSTAHAWLDFLENSVKRKVLHLASSYSLRERSLKILLYTPCIILQASRCAKPFVISPLKMDSFGLYSSLSA